MGAAEPRIDELTITPGARDERARTPTLRAGARRDAVGRLRTGSARAAAGPRPDRRSRPPPRAARAREAVAATAASASAGDSPTHPALRRQRYSSSRSY